MQCIQWNPTISTPSVIAGCRATRSLSMITQNIFSYVLSNIDRFFHARNLFQDDASRALFDRLILFRTLGHLTRAPSVQHARESCADPGGRETWKVTDTQDIGPFGPLAIYLVPSEERDIRIKGWKENVTWTFLLPAILLFARHRRDQTDARGHRHRCRRMFGRHGARICGCRGTTRTRPRLRPVADALRDYASGGRDRSQLEARISIHPHGLADHINDVEPPPTDGQINPGARLAETGIPVLTIDEAVRRFGIPAD